MFGLDPFKIFASAPIAVVDTAMIPQKNANTFEQFQIADPRDILTGFSIINYDTKREIVSQKSDVFMVISRFVLLMVLFKKIISAANQRLRSVDRFWGGLCRLHLRVISPRSEILCQPVSRGKRLWQVCVRLASRNRG